MRRDVEALFSVLYKISILYIHIDFRQMFSPSFLFSIVTCLSVIPAKLCIDISSSRMYNIM